MKVVLFGVQILLALHTLIGAVWKFSNSEQAVPTLARISHAGWMALIPLEICCAIGLVAPLFWGNMTQITTISASCIAFEMLLFTGVHLSAAHPANGQVVYWLVVAGISASVAFMSWYY